MKATISILIVFAFTFFNNVLYSQRDDEKYESSAEKGYYDSLGKRNSSVNFVPVNIEAAKTIPFPFIRYAKVDHPAIYNQNQVFSEFWDSTMQANNKNANDPGKFFELFEELRNVKLGPVPGMSIVKEQKFKDKWAILYTDSNSFY